MDIQQSGAVLGSQGSVERHLNLLETVDYSIAETSEQREQVYRLRYRRYRDDGLISAQADKRIYDAFDEAPNGRIYMLHYKGELVSSFRAHVRRSDADDIPSRHIFPDILEPLMDEGKTMFDPTRFVVDDLASRKFPELMAFTVRIAPMGSAYHELDYCLACVQPRHRAFYRRHFGLRIMCEPRPAHDVAQPVCLMMGTVEELRARYFSRFPHMALRPGEGERLFSTEPAANIVSFKPKATTQNQP